MPEIKNNFQKGKMNKDLDERLVPNGEYRDAMNVQVASSEESEVGTVQNILGNKRVETIIGPDFKCIGAVADEKNNVLYWFVTSLQVDAIIEYHDNGTVTPILVDTNKNVLKFDYNNIITGINIIDNLLFWTDNVNEPKKINIDTLKLNNLSINSNPPNHTLLTTHSALYVNGEYIEPLIEDHITVIRKRPNQAPVVVFKETSYNKVHSLGVDQSSVVSTINLNNVAQSDTLTFEYYLPTPLTGEFPPFTDLDVVVLDLIDSISFPNDFSLKLTVDSFSPINDVVTGDVIGATYNCTVVEIIGNWDDVDYEFLISKFVDKKNIFKKEFIRFATRYKYDDNEFSAFSPFTEPIFMAGRFGFHPTEDPYNLAMENTSVSILIQELVPPDIPKDVVQVDILFKKERSTTIYSIDSIKSNDPYPSNYWHKDSTLSSQSYLNSNGIGALVGLNNGVHVPKTFGRSGEYEITTENIYAALPSNQILRPWDNVPRKALAQEITANRVIYGNYLQNYNLTTSIGEVVKPRIVVGKENRISGEAYHSGSLPSFNDKKGRKHIKSLRNYTIGIVYGDRYGRETPIFTSKDASINIPFDLSDDPLVFNGAANKSLRLVASLKGEQPDWAYYFKYFIKQTTGEYYNLTMDRVYKADGDSNLWVSFPSSDRNKIQEGDYFSIKKQVDVELMIPVENNIKIIDIKNEAPESIKYDYVTIGSGGGNANDLSNLFVDPSAQPAEGVKRLLIDRDTWVNDENGLDIEDLSRSTRIAVQFTIQSNGGTIRSKKYFVSGFSLEDNGTTQRYNLLLKEPIREEDAWVESSPGVLNDAEALNVVIYKLQQKDAIEFEGRFFVKIISSFVTQTYLIPGIQDVYARQILGSLNLFRLGDAPEDLSAASEKKNFNVWSGSSGATGSNTAALFSSLITDSFSDSELDFDDISEFDGSNASGQGWFIDSLGFADAQEADTVFANRSGKMQKSVSGKHTSWIQDEYINGLEGIVSPNVNSSLQITAPATWGTDVNGSPTGARHWYNQIHELGSVSGTLPDVYNSPEYGSPPEDSNGDTDWDNTYIPVTDGGHWMHLSFMAPGLDLHNGDHSAFDELRSYHYTPNTGIKMMQRLWDDGGATVFQHICASTIYIDGYDNGSWLDGKYNFPTFSQSAQPTDRALGQWDPGYGGNASAQSIANNLEPGRRFVISGDDDENKVYTIKRVDIKRLYNHTTWNHSPTMRYDGVTGSGTGTVGDENSTFNPSVSFAMQEWFYYMGPGGGTANWEKTNDPDQSNALSRLENRITEFGRASNRRVCYILQLDQDPRSSTIDGVPFPGVATATGSQLIRFIDDYIEPGVNAIPISPAIFETEAKEDVDLNIYYEASNAIPIGLEGQQGQLLAPLGCKVTCGLSGSLANYSTMNQDLPGGDFALRVGGWNGNILTLEGPGLAVGGSAAPSGGTPLNQSLVYANKHLFFWRKDGSYTKARIERVITVSNNGTWVTEVKIQDSTWKEEVGLSWYNCFSFGNGVESNRIRDDYNESFILNGVKASTVLEEPYEEELRKHGLIYSGLYNSTSGVNNLNQFIQAEKITKDLMPSYGSIQKLYARDKDLITLCEDKVITIYVDKDILYNADGNTQLLATNRVLGSAEPFKGNFGISKNPESFATESFRAYFTDKQRGAVIRLSQNGLIPISSIGMHDFFRDNLKKGGKLYGSYDLHKGDYNLSIFYANGDNLIKNPGFEEDGTFLFQSSSEYLLNNEFTNTTFAGGNSLLIDNYGYNPGVFTYSQSNYFGQTSGGLAGWDYSSNISFSATNSPNLLDQQNIDGIISGVYNNANNSDGTGSVRISNPQNTDFISHDLSDMGLQVGTEVIVSWDMSQMIANTTTGPWTSDNKIKVWFLDMDGNGFIISPSEIRFHQVSGNSMHCSFTKTIQDLVDTSNPNLPGPGGTLTKWRLRFEIEGTNWGTSQFNIDNISASLPTLLTDNWYTLFHGGSVAGELLSFNHQQDVAIVPGMYQIKAVVSDVTPGISGNLKAGFQALGFDNYINITDNGSPISTPGVYHEDILVTVAGTHTFSFGEHLPYYRLDSISLKKITPYGGTVPPWDLNDNGSGNPYPGNIYFDEDFFGSKKVGFSGAFPGIFLSQELSNPQDCLIDSTYRVTFKISDYSGTGSLAFRMYNDQGEGFDTGGFMSNGTHEVFGVIGSSNTYNPLRKEKVAIYVEAGNNFTGKVDDITIEKYGGGDTVTFNEESKGWVSFKSFVPEFGISVVNQYYTMDQGKLYHHHNHDIDRNTFYGEFGESSVTPILNIQPDVVKNFNTINYEGSQSKIDTFTTLIQNGVGYTDDQYYNLYNRDGWYVSSVNTDKQEGQVNEFIEKEGKWFNYIKSDFGTIDPRAFNFQGIGIVKKVETFITGCMDESAINYDTEAEIPCQTCCIFAELGCVDPLANNYSSTANTNDGSCIYNVYGCTDAQADNYDATANIDDSTCTYPPVACESCGNCIPGAAPTVPCNGLPGCCDNTWDNYNPLATCNNGTCANLSSPSGTIPGCTDPLALNYEPYATLDDGSCLYNLNPGGGGGGTNTTVPTTADCKTVNQFEGCGDWNNFINGTSYSFSSITAMASHWYTMLSTSGYQYMTNGQVMTLDGLTLLLAQCCGTPSSRMQIFGCTDPSAENYISMSTVDDGGCCYTVGCSN